MKKKWLTFKKALIMFALIPLVVGSVVLLFISVSTATSSFVDNMEEELKLASKSLREYYEYDLINDNDLVDGFCEYDIRDHVNEVLRNNVFTSLYMFTFILYKKFKQ